MILLETVSKRRNISVIIPILSLQEVLDADGTWVCIKIAHNQFCAFEALSL